MPQLQIFSPFKEAIANAVHNLGTDTLNLALTNTAPSLSNSVLADITQIGSTGGYAPVTIGVTGSAQSGGTYTLGLEAVTFTASGADFEAFRYVVLYNDTAAGKNLIAFFDYGVPFTLANGESFSINAGNWLTNA